MMGTLLAAVFATKKKGPALRAGESTKYGRETEGQRRGQDCRRGKARGTPGEEHGQLVMRKVGSNDAFFVHPRLEFDGQ